jgi:cold shock CspA family protein
VQGTVATYDPEQRTGTVLLDDGTPLEFGRQAFEFSGLRLLRLGQRVWLRRGDDGVISAMRLVTMPPKS